MKKRHCYATTMIVLVTCVIGIVAASSAKAQAHNIKNDVFWNTKDGRPIYSQGGGIFRFSDPITGEKNITGMVFITLRQKSTVTIPR